MSTPPSLKLTVSCGERVPFEALPHYPAGPVHAADLAEIKAYSAAQSVWAVTVAGIVQRNSIKRNATATCLDALRADGLIY
jgi:hypothetical protein